MKISGIMSFRNPLMLGLPFVEAILSVIDIVDEYLVNDGGSTDGTINILKELATIHDKIVIYDMPDYPSDRWNCVSDQYNMLIGEANGKWIWMGNADEVIHERDTDRLRTTMLETDADILKFPRREISWDWQRLSEMPYWPSRAARNIDGLYMNWPSYGGDEFLDGSGWIHEPPRCKRADITQYHIYCVFPENVGAKRKNDALYVAREDPSRKRNYLSMGGGGYRVVDGTELDLPHLLHHLIGKPRYVPYTVSQ